MTIPVEVIPDDNAKIVFDSLSEILKSDNTIQNNLPVEYKEDNPKYAYDRPAGSTGKSSGDKKILLSFDYGPSTRPEIGPMTYAIMKQILKSGNEIHTMALWDTGLPMIAETKKKVLKDLNMDERDANIYDFGFKTGGEAVIKGMLFDIFEAFPGSKGKVDVHNLCDYDFVISFSAGSPGSKEWVQFGGDQSKSSCGKKVKVSTGVTAVQVTELLPYVGKDDDAQLTGIIQGATGAASYEALVGEPGKAHQRMTSQSYVHILIILLIMVGNVSYFMLYKWKD